MKKVNKAIKDVAMKTLKECEDVDIYSIPMTELSQLGRAIDTGKRDIKSKTRNPRDVLIMVAVR